MEPVINTLFPADPYVKGGAKVRRVAGQNRGTSPLFTPSHSGCQLLLIHRFDLSPEAAVA